MRIFAINIVKISKIDKKGTQFFSPKHIVKKYGHQLIF